MTRTPPCTVRPAGPDDLLAVLGVHARRDPGGERPSTASPRQRETWQRMTRSPDVTVYCAEVDGRVVGTATLTTVSNRRRGIATEIMRRVLADARAAGCNKVQLLSHKRHATDGGHRLYAGLGFAPEAEGFRLYLRQAPEAARRINPM